MAEEKLTKKQQKSQQFRKSEEDREKDNELKRNRQEDAPNKTQEPAKKKRKTRRGRGGKGRGGKGRGDSKSGNRFLVFVGGLPKDITQSELQAHFKSSSPDQIRIRSEKGIAFLEFDADKDLHNIQRRMDVALLQHRTELKGKKINVELTVGGGGNSAERLQKLKEKNIKLEEERRTRMAKMIQESSQKKANQEKGSPSESQPSTSHPQGIHPDRAKLIK